MEHRIRIDSRKTAAENAEFYYEEAKKAKQKLAGAKKALLDTRKKIEELKLRKDASIQEVPEMKKAKEKRWYDKFHSFYSSDGFFVVGGKDATTNEILIKKHVEKDDIVFHAEIHGAPFFVIKNPEGKEIPEQTLRETAEAAASYSRAWKTGVSSCDVYYVKPDQVSKSAPSGEYLGKGAFMIHGKKEYFRGTRLRLAIGFKVGGESEVLGGPVAAVESRTKYHVKIAVGDRKSEELAKEIKAAVLRKTGKVDAEKIKKIRLEDIQRLIPGGKGRVAD
jgi:predicted ribosome quality control (RQC) complex YloA/Tae2 family protein